MNRNICQSCNKRPVAVNYHKNGKIYYRTKCDCCSRIQTEQQPLWTKVGYKKKKECDKCGFASKYSEPFEVYYIDGNSSNCRINNLKTVCANCYCILTKFKLPWRQGDLKPDL